MVPVFALLSSFTLLLTFADASIHFSYRGEHGVGHWKEIFPNCGGRKQSPIAINSKTAKFDASLDSSIQFEAMPFQNANFSAVNNGHTVLVDVSSVQATLTGLGLLGEWAPAQIHFHWGEKNTIGSEHTLNGAKFPVEQHIVMRNTKYDDLVEAVRHSDGIAVLGVFYKVGKENSALDGIMEVIHHQQLNVTGVNVPLPAFRITSLLPANRKLFYRYDGSLTTPTCDEIVTWTVFSEAIELSSEQLETFRSLKNDEGEEIIENYRPPQALNGRTVRKSDAAFSHSNSLVMIISLALLLVSTKCLNC